MIFLGRQTNYNRSPLRRSFPHKLAAKYNFGIYLSLTQNLRLVNVPENIAVLVDFHDRKTKVKQRIFQMLAEPELPFADV